jgi:TolA-binding protein
MNRKIHLIFLFFLTAYLVSAQDPGGDVLLSRGLADMKSGNSAAAAESFRKIINDESMRSYYPDALYWLIKVDILLGEYNEAAGAADGFLSAYARHEYAQEITYQRGRLLFLEDNPDAAVTCLGSFIREYPDSVFVPSALYWTGESLMNLGRYEEADEIFAELLNRYPASVKREAARYRRSEISLMYRERELLDLIKWSHEEYLRDSEDFYRREAGYMKLIDDYRSRLNDVDKSVQNLINMKRLLSEKEQLLEIKAFYMDELLRLYNER